MSLGRLLNEGLRVVKERLAFRTLLPCEALAVFAVQKDTHASLSGAQMPLALRYKNSTPLD